MVATRRRHFARSGGNGSADRRHGRWRRCRLWRRRCRLVRSSHHHREQQPGQRQDAEADCDCMPVLARHHATWCRSPVNALSMARSTAPSVTALPVSLRLSLAMARDHNNPCFERGSGRAASAIKPAAHRSDKTCVQAEGSWSCIPRELVEQRDQTVGARLELREDPRIQRLHIGL